jgi:4-amino-4-deoxy-L-arabinose transferase-like glycosyltransferase
VFAAALAVRVGALILAMATGRFPEFWEPETIARNLVAGHGFVYRFMGTDRWAYYEPLYPFVVAGVYAVTDFNVVVLALVQCLVSALLAPVAYTLTQRVFGRSAAIAAGALVAIHPALSGYATKFHPVTFDALALVLVTLATLVFLEQPRARTVVALGAAIGLGTLTRPTILAFVAALSIWMLSAERRRRIWPHFAVALLIAVAIVTPWVVRNYIRLDAFVLTRSHVGFGFWLGNHPDATGGEGDPSDPTGRRSLFERAPVEFRNRVLAQPDEVAQDRVFMATALRYVIDEPGAFVSRTLRKLGYFWWFPPYLGKRYTTAEVWVHRVFEVAVLGLAIIGLLHWRGRRHLGDSEGVMIVILLLAAISLAQAVFYVQGRHRVAVDPVLMVLAGYGVAQLTRRRDVPARS